MEIKERIQQLMSEGLSKQEIYNILFEELYNPYREYVNGLYAEKRSISKIEDIKAEITSDIEGKINEVMEELSL